MCAYFLSARGRPLCTRLSLSFYPGLALLLMIVLSSCTGSSAVSRSMPLTARSTSLSRSVPIVASTTLDAGHGWNTVALAQPVLGDRASEHVLNYGYLSGKSAPLLAKTLPSPEFDGISPDGQDLLYQVSDGSQVEYYRALLTQPGTGFFYKLPVASAGNAIWLADSQHVLILLRSGGVMSVDTKSGQVQLLFSLPLLGAAGGQIDLASLTFFRNNYLYFVGAAGACEALLCRIELGTTRVQRISFRALNARYWLSPDGSTIFFATGAGPAGQAGIYAVNVDGSHLHLLRPYAQALPIGFAADNTLVILRQVKQRFVALKVGTTVDQVLVANVAPGAVSLCAPEVSAPGMPILCDASIALAPYGHALVVQATFADNTSKLWATDIITGKQQILQVGAGGSLATPVQLLGWDRMEIA